MPCACSTAWMILARVVLLDRAVTSNSSSPVSLIGASEHLVARCLVHGDALASHGGLVDGAIALGHLTVQRHAVRPA